ncbi:hypothetical protein K1T71_004071 [Dendrolimus kikuchii]|uniref:Uncharacterized protein n=1 Tax=Dendrolimus kikuchii TaxID=765133 RepID=A0ACC1DB88_9NEOP|nr:hypothetical protein K1T71_004071 [Dendrolimus kikuchii]
MIAGWGALKTTYFLPAMPQLLQEIKVAYISYKDCYRAFQDIEEEEAELLLKENVHICTGPIYGGVAACSGDSGGPLIEYVYFDSNIYNTDFNFNEPIVDEYGDTDDEYYTTPSSFWSRIQEMIEKYVSERERVINSIDRNELTTINTKEVTDDAEKNISERQSNDKSEVIPVVIGVVSWGISPCGYKGAPSVYTNVSYYMDFIQKYINT